MDLLTDHDTTSCQATIKEIHEDKDDIEHDTLLLDESQFTHLETGGYLISGNKEREAIFHGNPLLDVTEDIEHNAEEREQDLMEDLPDPDPVHLQQAVRRSSRIQTPSLRFLETIASNED